MSFDLPKRTDILAQITFVSTFWGKMVEIHDKNMLLNVYGHVDYMYTAGSKIIDKRHIKTVVWVVLEVQYTITRKDNNVLVKNEVRIKK